MLVHEILHLRNVRWFLCISTIQHLFMSGFGGSECKFHLSIFSSFSLYNLTTLWMDNKTRAASKKLYFILFLSLISVLTSFVAQCEEVCFWVLNVCAECSNCIRTCFISSDNFMPIKSGCTWNGFRRCMFFIFAASLEIVLTANFFFGWGVHHTRSSFKLYVPIFNWTFWSALLF